MFYNNSVIQIFIIISIIYFSKLNIFKHACELFIKQYYDNNFIDTKLLFIDSTNIRNIKGHDHL